MDDTKKRNGCRWLTVVFFITLLAAAAMVLYGGKAFSSGDVRVVRESAEELSGGGYYMSGNDRVEISALPAVIREEGTASLTLPTRFPGTLHYVWTATSRWWRLIWGKTVSISTGWRIIPRREESWDPFGI